MKGPNLGKELIAGQHLYYLGQHLFGTQPVTVSNLADFENSPIPSKDDSLFGQGDCDNFGIAIVVAIQGIETKQAQFCRQFAQMHIGDEAQRWRGITTEARQTWAGEAVEVGIDREVITGGQLMGKVDRPAISQNEIDFRMGYAKRLGAVFHRGRAVKRVAEKVVPLGLGQEII